MYIVIKRLFDMIISLLAVIVMMPIFIVSIMLIKIDSKGPILFKQKRIGKHKKHFNLLKFRTMRIETPKNTPTHLLDNPEQWITRIGKLLRKTSLDELPQFFNILVGQMSIIGPRPALWNQYDLIEERDRYGVHEILPGVTGLAQIKGRDELLIVDKAKFDGEYVKRISFWLDVKIFFGTILVILKFKGVVEGGTGALGKKANKKTDSQRDEL